MSDNLIVETHDRTLRAIYDIKTRSYENLLDSSGKKIHTQNLQILMVESSILWNYLADFLSPSSKNKRINSEKISYIFSKKAFLIFRKSTLKNIHIFSYIYRNGNPDSPQKLNKTF